MQFDDLIDFTFSLLLISFPPKKILTDKANGFLIRLMVPNHYTRQYFIFRYKSAFDLETLGIFILSMFNPANTPREFHVLSFQRRIHVVCL